MTFFLSFQSILVAERKAFHDSKVSFKDVGKFLYQIEVPIASANKRSQLPSTYTLISQTKVILSFVSFFFFLLLSFVLICFLQDYKRYHTQEIVENVKQLAYAEDSLNVIKQQLFQRVLAKFDKDYDGQ
jgi:hypothetical protein